MSRQYVWVRQLSRSLLIGDELVAVKALLIVGQHDGDAVAKGQVLPGDVEALPALATPGRADAGPDFLATPIFPGGLPVVDEVGWNVGHKVQLVILHSV